MKKIFTFLMTAAAMFGVLSCNKSNSGVEVEAPQPDGAITVRINMEDGTKAAFDPSYYNGTDRKINTVQIFVFDGTDPAQAKLETDFWDGNAAAAAAAAAGSYSKTIATFRGIKTVYAVINRPRLVLPKDFPLSKFEGRDASVYGTQYGADASCLIISNLNENSYGASMNLVMSGFNTVDVTEYNKNKVASDSPDNVNIVVKRLAALVKLSKVTVNFDGTSLEDATFTIKEMYLRNVVGKSCVGMVSKLGPTEAGDPSAEAAVLPLKLSEMAPATFQSSATWYNFGSLPAVRTAVPGVTFDENIGQEISGAYVKGSQTTVNRAFLAYPNPQDEDSNAAEFSPRHTRLVMKVLIQKTGIIANESDGTCWYTFDLPELKSNVLYDIANINITMFGSSADDDTLNDDPGRITAEVSVKAWTEGEALNYEL